MHIAIVTAGGAGMFCGSCMHDNTLARALLARGERVTLIPTYTPIRVDEKNVSQERVLLGGINLYLDTQVPGWGRLPRLLKGWLDSPAIIRLATRFSVSADARKLGKMTVAMLQGDHGPQQTEVEDFANYIANELKPDVVLYSNALLVGTLRRLKEKFAGPVVCLLQGDDIFLQDLIEPWKSRAFAILYRECEQFDAVLTHSGYYRDFMADYLRIPVEKMHVVPLGIDLAGHDGEPRAEASSPFTIGYFARICPEKGLHNLVAAFRILRSQRPDLPLRLHAGGYLGVRDQKWFESLQKDASDLGESFQYIGSPASHQEKVAFFKSVDLFSVPTDYHEPKGLYVLEALANGVPVVQPLHGGFPELIEATGGGLLVKPQDPEHLAAVLGQLIDDSRLRRKLATNGRRAVHERFNPQVMAENTLKVLEGLVPRFAD